MRSPASQQDGSAKRTGAGAQRSLLRERDDEHTRDELDAASALLDMLGGSSRAQPAQQIKVDSDDAP